MYSKDFDRSIYNDKFMQHAIKEAMKSKTEGGIPIGSVVVRSKRIIGTGHNRRVQEQNPIMHAELCSIEDAAKKNMNLRGAILYTTHMPCYLCAGAAVQFGIQKVIAGESETFPHARHILENNGIEVIDLDLGGCKTMLQDFVINNSQLWEGASNNNFPREKYDNDKIISPYEKQDYFNFYQYPVPVKVTRKDRQAMVGKLELDEETPGSKTFTLFVSVPYCRSKCHSCPFFKNLIPSDKKIADVLEGYLALMIEQIKGYSNTIRFTKASCGAVYVGGGTASLLSWPQVQLLIDKIRNSFRTTKNDIEITLEGNPRDFSKEYLSRIKKAGVNRLSIGLQSFHDKLLKRSLGSPHDSSAALASLKDALNLGFKTVNVDLLYGIPGQKESDWRSDIRRIISMAPQSITIYRYVVHPNSASEKMIQKGLLEKQPDDQEIYALYSWAYEKFKDEGYSEKRFGCFARPGHAQRYSQLSYNLSYESIGIGAGAYSFINGYVFRTSKNVKNFRRDIEKGMYHIEDYLSTRATEKNRMERYIMHNLFSSILSRKNFLDIFNHDVLEVFPLIFAKLWRYRLVHIDEEDITVTALGKRYIQNILYEFYSV